MTSAPAGTFYNTAKGVLYYKNSLATTTNVTLTPTGGITENDSGIQGYRKTSGGAITATASWLISDAGKTIYVVDNCGNESSGILMTFTVDGTVPAITPSISANYGGATAGPYNTSFTAGTADDIGSGMSVTVTPVITYSNPGDWDDNLGDQTFTANAGVTYNASTGIISTVASPGNKDWYKIVFTDNVGNTNTWYIKRQPDGGQYRVWTHSFVDAVATFRGTTFITEKTGDTTTISIERPALTNAYYTTARRARQMGSSDEKNRKNRRMLLSKLRTW